MLVKSSSFCETPPFGRDPHRRRDHERARREGLPRRPSIVRHDQEEEGQEENLPPNNDNNKILAKIHVDTNSSSSTTNSTVGFKTCTKDEKRLADEPSLSEDDECNLSSNQNSSSHDAHVGLDNANATNTNSDKTEAGSFAMAANSEYFKALFHKIGMWFCKLLVIGPMIKLLFVVVRHSLALIGGLMDLFVNLVVKVFTATVPLIKDSGFRGLDGLKQFGEEVSECLYSSSTDFRSFAAGAINAWHSKIAPVLHEGVEVLHVAVCKILEEGCNLINGVSVTVAALFRTLAAGALHEWHSKIAPVIQDGVELVHVALCKMFEEGCNLIHGASVAAAAFFRLKIIGGWVLVTKSLKGLTSICEQVKDQLSQQFVFDGKIAIVCSVPVVLGVFAMFLNFRENANEA